MERCLGDLRVGTWRLWGLGDPGSLLRDYEPSLFGAALGRPGWLGEALPSWRLVCRSALGLWDSGGRGQEGMEESEISSSHRRTGTGSGVGVTVNYLLHQQGPSLLGSERPVEITVLRGHLLLPSPPLDGLGSPLSEAWTGPFLLCRGMDPLGQAQPSGHLAGRQSAAPWPS